MFWISEKCYSYIFTYCIKYNDFSKVNFSLIEISNLFDNYIIVPVKKLYIKHFYQSSPIKHSN